MAAEFLARTKVSFVKTAVLSSNDGGNTFSEETIIKEKTDEQEIRLVKMNSID